MTFRLLQLFLLVTSLLVAGCAQQGGTAGDQNDPEASGTDAEQMDDESGDV